MKELIALAAKAKAARTNTEKKTRKPYPSYEERITAADAKIAKLEALIADRSKLIDKTAKILAERTETMNKNQATLEKTIAKKERLIRNMNKANAGEKVKLTAEQIAEKRKAALARRREIKKAEKAKQEALMGALQDKGITIDELIEQLKK